MLLKNCTCRPSDLAGVLGWGLDFIAGSNKQAAVKQICFGDRVRIIYAH